MRIRRLELDDFAALAKYDFSPLIAERDTIYLFLVRDHGACSFVAEDEAGMPLGYAVGARSADGVSVFLFHLHVRRRYRSQGVGTALMAHLEGAAHAAGVQKVWFLAGDKAKPFYARLGYVDALGDLPRELARYVRCVKTSTLMEKTLTTSGEHNVGDVAGKNSRKEV